MNNTNVKHAIDQSEKSSQSDTLSNRMERKELHAKSIFQTNFCMNFLSVLFIALHEIVYANHWGNWLTFHSFSF